MLTGLTVALASVPIVARREGLKAGKNGNKLSTTRFVATTRFLIPWLA